MNFLDMNVALNTMNPNQTIITTFKLTLIFTMFIGHCIVIHSTDYSLTSIFLELLQNVPKFDILDTNIPLGEMM
jgi:hypothetical protein